ncbi:MAG: phage protein Gp36 family protein [Oceanihabitans sp.]
MIYITEDDLKTESFERFIDESTKDFPDVKNTAELKAIGLCITLLKGRYDVAVIFDETTPIRDEYLADIVTKLTIYKIFRRNAARKLPTDLKDDYDWAMKQLEKINAGRLTLDLPLAGSTSGAPSGDIIWGNNTNKNHYI